MKLFYDHLIDKRKLVKEIETKSKNEYEKTDHLRILDEIIHNSVLDVILTNLDEKHHEEFLVMLHKSPHDLGLLVYLKSRAHPKIEEKIKTRFKNLRTKILKET